MMICYLTTKLKIQGLLSMRNNIIIEKVINYAEKIINYSNGKNYESFSNDTMLVEACVFNLSQIGELVRHLDRDFIEQHSDIPWAQMRGLRNRIIHDYEGVNLMLVWEIIKYDIPTLIVKLKEIQ